MIYLLFLFFTVFFKTTSVLALPKEACPFYKKMCKEASDVENRLNVLKKENETLYFSSKILIQDNLKKLGIDLGSLNSDQKMGLDRTLLWTLEPDKKKSLSIIISQFLQCAGFDLDISNKLLQAIREKDVKSPKECAREKDESAEPTKPAASEKEIFFNRLSNLSSEEKKQTKSNKSKIKEFFEEHGIPFDKTYAVQINSILYRLLIPSDHNMKIISKSLESCGLTFEATEELVNHLKHSQEEYFQQINQDRKRRDSNREFLENFKTDHKKRKRERFDKIQSQAREQAAAELAEKFRTIQENWLAKIQDSNSEVIKTDNPFETSNSESDSTEEELPKKKPKRSHYNFLLLGTVATALSIFLYFIKKSSHRKRRCEDQCKNNQPSSKQKRENWFKNAAK